MAATVQLPKAKFFLWPQQGRPQWTPESLPQPPLRSRPLCHVQQGPAHLLASVPHRGPVLLALLCTEQQPVGAKCYGYDLLYLCFYSFVLTLAHPHRSGRCQVTTSLSPALPLVCSRDTFQPSNICSWSFSPPHQPRNHKCGEVHCLATSNVRPEFKDRQTATCCSPMPSFTFQCFRQRNHGPFRPRHSHDCPHPWCQGFLFLWLPRVRIQGAPQPKGTAVPPPHDPRFSSPIDTSVSRRPEQAKSIIIRAGGHGSIRRLLDFSQFLRKAPATQNVPEFSVLC